MPFRKLGEPLFSRGIIARSSLGSMLANQQAPYWQRVVNMFGSALIGYYPMAELSGTTLIDKSGIAGNGAYSANIALNNAAGIGDGANAPLFASSYANALTTALNTAFNPAEFTVWLWAKVVNAGVWTDNTKRYLCMVFADNSNYFELYKDTNNRVYIRAYSGGTLVTVDSGAGFNPTGWMMFALTFSKTDNQMKGYYNGAQMSTTQTTGGVWNGPALVKAVFGGYNLTPAFPWSGWMAQGGILNRPATLLEIQRLYNLNP